MTIRHSQTQDDNTSLYFRNTGNFANQKVASQTASCIFKSHCTVCYPGYWEQLFDNVSTVDMYVQEVLFGNTIHVLSVYSPPVFRYFWVWVGDNTLTWTHCLIFQDLSTIIILLSR